MAVQHGAEKTHDYRHTHTHTHTHTVIKQLPLFRGNNYYTNAPQSYVIRTSSVSI